MTVDTHEIYEGLSECRDLPPGRTRSARTEELVARAETSGERPALAYALLELVEAYYLSTESAKAFVPFARVLRMYDEDPSDFDNYDTHSLFWSFKWMSSGMKDHAEVSLAQIEGVLADMRRRYSAAGFSLNAVYTSEFAVAWRTGDEARAADAYERWQASEPDEMSHCEACNPSLRAEWLAEHGRLSEAVELLRIVTTGGLTCGDEPESALATSLLPLVRVGELDEARANHIRGYRLVRGEPTDQDKVGLHLEFCALTGNVDRGLALWAENVALLDATEEAASHLHLLRGLLTLLEQACATAGPDVEVAGRGGPTGAGALRAEVAAEAYAIAERFDTRNRTDRYRRLVDESIHAKPLVDRLPFVGPGLAGSGAFVLPETGVPLTGADRAAGGAGPTDAAATPVGDDLLAPADVEPDGEELALRTAIDRARERGDLGGVAEAASSLATHVAQAGRPAVAAEHALLAARAYEAHGDEDSSLRCYVDLVELYLGLDRAAEAAELAEQLVEPAGSVGHAVRYRVLRLLGAALGSLDDHAGAAARHIAAARIAESADERWAAADSAFAAGDALLGAGRPGDAAEAFTRAADHDEAAGVPVACAQALRRAAGGHVGAGTPEHARAALDRARAGLAAALDGLPGDAEDAQAFEAALCFERGEVEDMTARLVAGTADGQDGLDVAVGAAAAAADWFARAGAWADESAAAALAAHLVANRLERPADAEAWARRALAVVPPAGADGVEPQLRAARSAQAHEQLADVLRALGRDAEADAAATQASSGWAEVYGDEDDDVLGGDAADVGDLGNDGSADSADGPVDDGDRFGGYR
jgi:tetratricopeptide (TPR) repeat protein